MTNRAAASPRFANVCKTSGGTRTKVPGAGDDLFAVDRERQLAFEDVERVVLAGVTVHVGTVAVRLDRDDRQIEPRCVLAAREELDVPNTVPLARWNNDRALRPHRSDRTPKRPLSHRFSTMRARTACSVAAT